MQTLNFPGKWKKEIKILPMINTPSAMINTTGGIKMINTVNAMVSTTAAGTMINMINAMMGTTAGGAMINTANAMKGMKTTRTGIGEGAGFLSPGEEIVVINTTGVASPMEGTGTKRIDNFLLTGSHFDSEVPFL